LCSEIQALPMKQIISKLINNPVSLLLLASFLGFASASSAYATDILQQADQAYEIKEYEKAKDLYLKAAEQEEAHAQFRLGELYYYGDGVPQDYAKAREWFLKAAEQGNSNAENYLGAILANGDGVTQDYEKAREWFLKAAEQGVAAAQRNLAIIYYNGHGVPQDSAKANEWFLKAAEQGDVKAQYSLGTQYEFGDGVPKDSAKARELFLKAAQKGNKNASAILIQLEMIEDIPSPDTIKSLKTLLADDYFSEPIENDTISVLDDLYLRTHLADGIWQENISRHDKDFRFEREAALERLSTLIKFPKGVRQLNHLATFHPLFVFVNKDQFQNLFNTLLENLESSNSDLRMQSAGFLGLYYDDGYLEPKNPGLAKKYFKIAADLGSQFAQQRIGWNFINSGNFDEAIRYLTLAAKSNKDTNLQMRSLNDLALAQTLIGENIQTIIENFREASRLASLSSSDFYYPAENLVRIYLSEKSGVSKNLQEAEKFSKLMKAEGHEGILYDAFNAMNTDDRLRLIDVLEQYDDQSSAIFERAVYYYGISEEEAFKNFTICANIGSDPDEQENCKHMAALIKAKMPGELAYLLEQEARTKQSELLLASRNNDPMEDAGANGPEAGNQYALLISNSNYDNLDDLKSPQKDARVLSEILKLNYGYNVELISNASRREIIKSFNELRGKLEPEDNLIVYYAGHGKSDGDTSFWLPREAFPEDDTDWIEDSTIERKIGQMKARNILVIADSCFSGNLTRGVNIVSVDTDEEVLKTYRNTISRVAITSGGDEPILDRGPSGHSIFAAALIDFLKSQKTGFTAQELSLGISERVLKTSIEYGLKQTPSYGQLFNAGHVGLDFVFTPEK
jgi:TPR repeat protein